MSLLVIGVIICLTVGHILRAVRQATLFPEGSRPGTFNLTVGLSIGYVINALTPFRIGEIARMFYVAWRANQRFGTVCATVIAERLSDLIVVALALLTASILSNDTPLLQSAVWMAVAAVAIILFASLIQSSARTRSFFWSGASLFNERIQLNLADAAWTTTQLLNSNALIRPHYILLTAAMWAAYLAAYVLLGAAVGVDTFTVIAALFGSPMNSLLSAQSFASQIVPITSLAAVLILVAGLAADGIGIRGSIRKALSVGLPKQELALAFAGHSFERSSDYGAMLGAHFTNEKSTIAKFGLQGLEGAKVLRLLPGGSDAITAVVEVSDHLAIRKFATGDVSAKLAEQARWLENHRSELPLASVISKTHGPAKFHYDMPFLASARDLYEMAHMMPLAEAQSVLADVVDRVSNWHDLHACAACKEEDLDAYIDQKVIANARAVLEFARGHLPQHYSINGQAFDLAEWDCLTDREWVRAQIPSRRVGMIHGDLTIENIVVCPETELGWYLIDPNPGNLFDSPLIDWAKLMQSLNLGYESLNKGPDAHVRQGAIDVMFHRSRIYADLHASLSGQLKGMLGDEQLREVSFHEIVNYLRLIPYKIRRNPAKTMNFFACASILLRRYAEGEHA